ncbi:SUR7/PalI family-domain-containing protein [Crassisporium funariophilum]|nr:SUR7/PalI family-domain-containing protein [Crassisporium funariophilum]
MGCIRPATPGFIVTLVATALLAVVCFCVPYFKSIYFLKATITVENTTGSITFGTLGYCLELANGTTCSKPSIGYELDINGLVGNKLPFEIPQMAVKWITYALVLHIVALAGAAGSAVFGLLAHVREMSMTCCSTFISGFAAVIAMLAFIFDLVLFFVAKARINAVGSAQIGNAIWLTLAAWLLLFFSGCFYTLGRCCVSSRPRAPSSGKKDGKGGFGGNWGSRSDPETGPNKTNYAEQMRLDAVKAEADRKAKQKQGEGGLPAFYETQPLTGRVDGDSVYVDDHHGDSMANLPGNAAPPGRQQAGYTAGYAPAASGTRAMDDYYALSQPTTPAHNTYPPQRQGSSYAASTYTANVPHSPTAQHSLPPNAAGYGAGVAYGQSPYGYNAPLTTSPPPSNQLLAAPGQYNDPYGQNPREQYSHSAGGTSYHTASSHEQQPTSYSQYDPYGAQSQPPQHPHYAEPSYNADPYGHIAQANPAMPSAVSYAGATPNPYYSTPSSPPPQLSQQQQHDRSYTLGGDGYGASTVPPLQEYNNVPGGYYAYGGEEPSRPSHGAPIDTNLGYASSPQTSPVRGPRAQPGAPLAPLEDSPPGYDTGTSGVTGNWGKR